MLGKPGRTAAYADATSRLFYGPATPTDFGERAALAKPPGTRLWAQLEDDLDEVTVGERPARVLRDDFAETMIPRGGVE